MSFVICLSETHAKFGNRKKKHLAKKRERKNQGERERGMNEEI